MGVLCLAACGGDSGSTGETPAADAVVEDRGFDLRCEVSHVSFDDPIVLPWQPGASHQHQFFGNRTVDSSPGYSRVAGGPSSCDDPDASPAYWTPTLLDGAGRRVDSIGATAFHRVRDGIEPTEVVAYPPGFTVVAGPTPPSGPEAGTIRWACGTEWVPVGEGSDEAAPPACAADQVLRLWITFPDCWDGLRESSFGSGAHVRFSTGSPSACPASHPVPVPQLTLAVDYPPVDPQGLSVSSGELRTLHADFWNTWDQARLERLVTECFAGIGCVG